MSWNYRVIKRGEDFAIYECYYNDANKPNALSKDAVPAHAESIEDLHLCFDLMRGALDKPILNYDDFI